MQQVLGAIYAVERLDPAIRRQLVPALRRAFAWRGPIGTAFISHMAGTKSSDVNALADPRAWALDILHEETLRALTLLGCPSLQALSREHLRAAGNPSIPSTDF